ncbi:MAG: type II toxin-antitoxin system RelE/ParE family toxin [Bacteroidaceae bacterium]|nr:type II toxin-antitoxin system RelE/ParE family toxin [Bacteroidaceae bacterium]
MKRTIKAYGSYYKDFFNTLDKQIQEKILYGMLLLKTQGRLPSKFVKYIRDGLYELRIEWQGNIYRIFFCFDQGNIVILFNGFQKKTQKTPEKEIEKGLKLKAEYEEKKRNRNV